MTLCDTGPLIALIDGDDLYHVRCVNALEALPAEPLVTTWPCLTEAMYLLSRAGGHPAQEELWSFVADGLVILHLPEEHEWQRIRALIQQYHDTPMDLGDASLVAAAEQLELRRVFTLDRHFHAYRINSKDSFEIVP